MAELDENFAYRASVNGAPQSARPLTEEQIQHLQSILPESLVAFLVKFGFGTYFNGLYRMCDPIELRSVLALVFKADKDFDHRGCHVVGHSAFGHLWVWSQRHQVVRIDLPTGMIFSEKLAPTAFKDMPVVKKAVDDNRIAISLIPRTQDDADFSDAFDEPMYDRCRAAYGTVATDECYGFFPALALTGIFSDARRLENIKRVKALEHYSILAQMDTFYLTKITSSGFEAVRPIG